MTQTLTLMKRKAISAGEEHVEHLSGNHILNPAPFTKGRNEILDRFGAIYDNEVYCDGT
jgi:hypothetical protein